MQPLILVLAESLTGKRGLPNHLAVLRVMWEDLVWITPGMGT